MLIYSKLIEGSVIRITIKSQECGKNKINVEANKNGMILKTENHVNKEGENLVVEFEYRVLYVKQIL